MKKKFFAVALATTMALSTVMTANAAELYTKDYSFTSNDAYEEVDNPLKGKNLDKVVIEYTCTTGEGAAANGWDGLFAFYNPETKGRISFQTRPYLCWNDVDGGAGYIDVNHPDKGGDFVLKAGEKQTVVWTITADGATCTVDGTAVNTGTLGTSDPAPTFQALLDAFNTYPKLTIGVGQATSSYWFTELASGTIKFSDGAAAGNDADKPATGNDADKPAAGNSADKPAAGNSADKQAAGKDTPRTGDVAPIAALGAVAVIACAGVVVSRKKVTE